MFIVASKSLNFHLMFMMRLLMKMSKFFLLVFIQSDLTNVPIDTNINGITYMEEINIISDCIAKAIAIR